MRHAWAAGDCPRPSGSCRGSTRCECRRSRRSRRCRRAPSPSNRRVEDEVLEDLERHAGLGGAGDEFICFREADTHRLLERDMLLRAHRGSCDLGVKVMRHQDLDHVDLFQGEQLLVVGEDTILRHPPRVRAVACVVDVRVAHCGDASGVEAFVSCGMKVRNAAASDDADVDHVDSFRVAEATHCCSWSALDGAGCETGGELLLEDDEDDQRREAPHTRQGRLAGRTRRGMAPAAT